MRVLCLAFAVLFTGCSTKKGDGDGTPPAVDAGAYAYSPTGCAYTVTPVLGRGYTDSQADGDKGGPPLRVRVGLGGTTKSGAPGYADPTTSAVFTWETEEGSTAAKVRLGTSPSALGDVHAGYSWTTPPPTAGFGANEPGASMHEVHVCGLQPGTTYTYQVGGGSPEVWSDPQQLTTPPKTGKVTLGLSGDSRDSADIFQAVQSRMRDLAVNMQLFSGDLLLYGTQQSLYASFLDKAWKDPGGKLLTLGQQLMVVIPGNHENDSVQFFGNFSLPGDGPNAETYGSFDVGGAHVAVLDDQALAAGPDSDTSKEQLAWLDDDLGKADANRASVPFVLVMHHRGEFSTSDHSDDADVVRVRDELVPVWDKHHVDLVLNGHDHNYERSKPVTGPASSPTVQTTPNAGTTYVVCAGSGASAYSPGAAPAAYREKNVGFGGSTGYSGVYAVLTVDGRKLHFSAYGLKAAAPDDEIDSFDLSR
jgi:acid phosphatase type 7